jgi:hypothetical protein
MKKLMIVLFLQLLFVTRSYASQETPPLYNLITYPEVEGFIFYPICLNDKSEIYGKYLTLKPYEEEKRESSEDYYDWRDWNKSEDFEDSFNDQEDDSSEEDYSLKSCNLIDILENDFIKKAYNNSHHLTLEDGIYVMNKSQDYQLIATPLLGHERVRMSINNSGQAIVHDYGKMYLWDLSKGLKKLTLERPEIMDINDSGEFIVSNHTESFRFNHLELFDSENDKMRKANKEFHRHLKKLGYRDLKKIELYKINNAGSLLGRFYDGYSPREGIFLWNGKMNVKILDWDLVRGGNCYFSLNNLDTFMVGFESGLTLIWNKDNGFQQIENFIGVKINDQSTIIGYKKIDRYGTPAVYKDGKVYEIKELIDLSSVEGMCDFTVLDINNLDQILFSYSEWGNEKKTCLMDPVNN